MTDIIIGVFAVLAAIAVFSAVYGFIVSRTLKRRIRATEIHTVRTPDGWQIKLYRYRPASGSGEPVFLCHGVMENQFTFTSPPGHSLVDVLMSKGYDCWVAELRGDRSSTPRYGQTRAEGRFDEYLTQDLPAALRYVREFTGFPQVHWVGHSMGGMLLYTYELVHGRGEIASGTTLGTPPGFAGAKVPRVRALLAVLGFAPGLFEFYLRVLSPAFPILKIPIPLAPVNWNNMHPLTGPSTFYNLVEAPTFDVAVKLTTWGNTNDWRVMNTKIDVNAGLKTLETPLFVIYGKADAFVSIETAQEFYDALPSPDKKLLILAKENGHAEDYSHVDLVFAKKGPVEVYEPIAGWLAAHAIAAPVTGNPDAPKRTKTKPGKTAVAKKKTAKKAVKKKAAAKKPAKKKAKRK